MEVGGRFTGAAAYPLRVGPDRRCLLDRMGMPFLLHGEAAWSLITALTREQAERYLSDRAHKGFNSIIVNLIEHKFNGPVNRYGEAPFTSLNSFSTPNEEYFAHADWVVRMAGEYGIQVLLAPIYLGYLGTDEGWIEQVLASGPSGCREWGRYVGQRYGRFDNIIWLMGADREPGEALDCVDATVEGIREFDRRHLFTAGTAPERSSADDFRRGGWLGLNNTYTYGIVHRKLLSDYNRRPLMPFILIESTYEGEHNASAVQIRRQAYWALLCGACGHVFGNRPLWLFDPGWQEALDSPGSRDMVHVQRLFLSRPWHHLVPDQKHQVVTTGMGEFRGLDTLAAARTTDGGTVIVYMPSSRTVTIDLSRLRGSSVKAWWFDPRTGKPESAGEFVASGCREFTPPAEGDWVLVVDDAGRNWPAPGAADYRGGT
jgi:hypothetical protein